MGNGQLGLTTAGRPHAAGSSRLLRAKPWTDGGVIWGPSQATPASDSIVADAELLPRWKSRDRRSPSLMILVLGGSAIACPALVAEWAVDNINPIILVLQ